MSVVFLSLALAAAYPRPGLVVESDWLEAHLGDPNLRVVDTRTAGYAESHVPGAVHLDIEASRDAKTPPTYLPDMGRFVETLEKLGISNETRVVFYDDRGGIYGTRPWVLLRAVGHRNAAILNGGWTKWTVEGRTTTAVVPAVARGHLDPREDSRWIATAEDVAAAIARDDIRILDTRTEAEISGTDRRGNPRGGAIPSSTPLYWEDTLESDGTFKPPTALRSLFESRGVERTERVITYCQGGGRAAHELFVLYLMGYDDLRLYLGSFEDWSRRKELPVEVRRK